MNDRMFQWLFLEQNGTHVIALTGIVLALAICAIAMLIRSPQQ
ncbi:MAG: hypothetical protein WDN47_02875 [Candidatus Doudnabacteria bacterium]